MKFYDVGNRDIMGQDEQGGYYFRHVNALTAEALHSKSDIAAELAHRDIQIDQLTAERDMLVQIKIDLVAKVEELEKRLTAADGDCDDRG